MAALAQIWSRAQGTSICRGCDQKRKKKSLPRIHNFYIHWKLKKKKIMWLAFRWWSGTKSAISLRHACQNKRMMPFQNFYLPKQSLNWVKESCGVRIRKTNIFERSNKSPLSHKFMANSTKALQSSATSYTQLSHTHNTHNELYNMYLAKKFLWVLKLVEYFFPITGSLNFSPSLFGRERKGQAEGRRGLGTYEYKKL